MWKIMHFLQTNTYTKYNIINWQFIAGLWFYTAVIFKDFIL